MANKYKFHPEWSSLKNSAIAAKSVGEQFYYTGKHCKRGHVSPRYASSGNCRDCIADKRGKTKINFRNGKSLRSQENQKRAETAIDNGETKYHSDKPCPKGHSERFVTTNNCVECSRLAMAERSDRAKWSRIKRLYGMTKDGFYSRLKNQKCKCPICKADIDDGQKTHVDHCHKTGKVRGLLCSRCNQAIGLLDENENSIKSALEYIKNGT